VSSPLTAGEAGDTSPSEPEVEAGTSRTAARSRLWASGRSALEGHASAIPAYLALGLSVLWAAHDGGFDQDTWYWGALLLLAVLAAGAIGTATTWRPSRLTRLAILGFALYTAWAYISIAWSSSPGDALSGSNRSLLYLLIFVAFSIPRWRSRQIAAVLVLYALGVGAIAALILIDMTAGRHLATLFSEGRLLTPTGYFNSNAALFTATALLAVALSARRELPTLVRGLLLAVACAATDVALLAQSRGWLFTLPFVIVVAIAITRDRLRVTAAAMLPAVGVLVAARPLLDVYKATTATHPAASALASAAQRAGRISLLVVGGVLVAATFLAWLDARPGDRRLTRSWRRAIGITVTLLALAAGVAGGTAATHGHPVRFIKDQWNGFTRAHPPTTSTSHFGDIGSGRYDAWRVSLDAFLAHPIGGLGQDNFADYYILRRRANLELQWTHSLEMRLLAHTGLIGTLAFALFLVAAVAAALRTRLMEGFTGTVAGLAMLPFVVWLIHGSVDWFWEIPALTAPALGFLAMAGGLFPRPATAGAPVRLPRNALSPRLTLGVGFLAFVAAIIALGLPYLSVREVSVANDVRGINPRQALSDLSTAADLNPLNADPGRVGGTIALQNGLYAEAERRFEQATVREPGGWYGWLGAGLAASALGQRTSARHDFRLAASINSRQPVVTEALARADTAHPLTPAEALRMLVVVG
jgi:hypothetical protein